MFSPMCEKRFKTSVFHNLLCCFIFIFIFALVPFQVYSASNSGKGNQNSAWKTFQA